MSLPLLSTPSRYVPYPANTTISVRPLTLGEVNFVTEHNLQPAVIISYLREQKVFTGIDLFDVTYDDWRFLELNLSALTWPSATYTVDGGSCPKCGHEVTSATYEFDGVGKVTKEIRGKMQTVLVPQSLSFNELDDAVTGPATITLMGTVAEEPDTCTVDFFRVRHYLAVIKAIGSTPEAPRSLQRYKKDDPAIFDDVDYILYQDSLRDYENKWIRARNEAICGRSYNDLSVGDDILINTALNMMSHAIKSEVELACTVCTHRHSVKTVWEVTSFFPFHESGASPRDRISFNAPPKSEPTSTAAGRLSKRPVALQADT